MAKYVFAIAAACLLVVGTAYAQDDHTMGEKIIQAPNRFLRGVSRKSQDLEERLLKKSEKALHRLKREEQRLKRKLLKKDPALAGKLFPEGTGEPMQKRLAKLNQIKEGSPLSEYSPHLDSLTTSLRFLTQSPLSKKGAAGALTRVQSMQDRFSRANDLEGYLRERRTYLKERLRGAGLLKELKRYNKEVYYYSAQLEAYKRELSSPEALERKALSLLCKTKAFQSFFQKHSIIGSLFPGSMNSFGGGGASLPALPGLQTSAQLSGLMAQTLATSTSAMQSMQAVLQSAQAPLAELKKLVPKEGGNSDEDLPSFKPNHQRVKSFWKRLELGTDLQSARGNNWLPASTRFGASVGYRLNDKTVVGIGMACSAGYTGGLRRLSVTYQGASVRSFFDLKIKATFWITAGFELNYQQAFTKVQALKDLNAWQQSGLAGLSKKYHITKKFAGKVSLLWDYLSYTQIPRTQPLIFRYNYSLK